MNSQYKGLVSLAISALVLVACSTPPNTVNQTNSGILTNYDSKTRMTINNDSKSLTNRITYTDKLIKIVPKSGFSTKAEPDFRIRQVAQVFPFKVHNDTVQASNIYISEDGKTAYLSYDIWKTPFGGGVQIIDISDPYHPVMKAEMSLNDTDIYDLMQKNDRLYMAGASGGTDGYPPAFLEIMSLKGQTAFDISLKKVSVTSYAATGVDIINDKLLVTSGDKGGALTAINSSNYEIDKTFPANDARDVSVEGTKTAVIGATPGKVYTYENGVQKNVFDIPGATIPVSQSTIQVKNNMIYMAAGNGGFIAMDYNTGEIKFNYKADSGITNGVSYDNERVFLANGDDGISVMEETNGDNKFTELGRLDFDGPYSSNVVVNKNCMLFTATGLGGLTISVIEDSKTGASCYKAPSPSPTPVPSLTPTLLPSATATPEPSTTPSSMPTPSSTPVPTPPPTSCSAEEGFLGWYVYDDLKPYETVSNINFKVDFHGDTDLYYYEPSGGHGLMDPTINKEEAFKKIETHILTNVDRLKTSDTFSYDTSSTLETFKEGTYTYALSYLYVPQGDKSKYTLEVGSVDDGITVLVNANQVGYMKLGDAKKTFDIGTSIDGKATLKECRNTVIVILADDSKVQKFIREVKFLRDGQQIPHLDPKQFGDNVQG